MYARAAPPRKGSVWRRRARLTRERFAPEGRSFAGVSGDAGSGTAAFSYDGLGRVTASSGLLRSDAFSYDRNGNRISTSEGAISTTYTYDRADQLISQTISGGPTTAFAYNTWGDMTAAADDDGGQTTHAFDAGGRMISLTPPGAAAAGYTYDALGRVATRSVSGASLTYRYVGVGHVTYASVPGAGSATYALIDAADSRLAVNTGGTTAWSVFDAHGNFAGATASGSATIVNAVRYDAWGATLDDYVAGSGSTATPWRFQGRLDVSPDADEPLYDYGARMYRPSGGTFTQLDTYPGGAQNPLSMNRYLYAHANPMTLVDPTGHCAQCTEMIDGYVATPEQGKNAAVTSEAAKQQGKAASSQGTADVAAVASQLSDAAQRARTRIDQANELARFRSYQARVVHMRIEAQQQAVEGSSNDLAHTALDGCGLVSFVGTFCDLGNALLYALEGDLFNAGLSVAAIVPGASEAIGGARLGARTANQVVGAVAGGTRRSDRGVSVIGHTHDDYEGLADALGANHFRLDDDIWSGLSRNEAWDLNRQFLDNSIARGDDFLLATPIDQIVSGSFTEMEVDYLLSHGYLLSPDGWALIAP